MAQNISSPTAKNISEHKSPATVFGPQPDRDSYVETLEDIAKPKAQAPKTSSPSVASLGRCGMCDEQYQLVRDSEVWWPSA